MARGRSRRQSPPPEGGRFKAVDDAYRAGDMEGLRQALGDPPDFPNCLQPVELGISEHPLEYAIYWSPLSFIIALLDLGADPNYPDDTGFPSLIAALSTGREDREALLNLLIDRGGDLKQRGINDWTPLHYAVWARDLPAVALLLGRGADPSIPTRIDDTTTPKEDAEAIGLVEAVRLMAQLS